MGAGKREILYRAIETDNHALVKKYYLNFSLPQ